MANNKIYIVVALALSAATLISCSKDDDNAAGGQYSADNQNANTPRSGEESVLGYEVPKLNPDYDYICQRLPQGEINYCIEYVKEKLHPHWVAYSYNVKNAQKNAPNRTEAWSPDPYYDSQKQYQLSTQTFPGYSRGHLVGSAERYFSSEANEQTFFMTNMSPQLSAFNNDYWAEIEDKARDVWGRGVIDQKSSFYEGTLYIVKGGTIDKEENILEYIYVKNTLSQTVQMPVPRYYFMACLFVSSSGEAKAIGFWMEHKDYNLNTSNAVVMQNFRRSAVCTVDDLEQRTGIDFFCNLPDIVEEALESKYDITAWPDL